MPDYVFSQIHDAIKNHKYWKASATRRKKEDKRESDIRASVMAKEKALENMSAYLGWELENKEFSRKYITGEDEEQQGKRIKGWTDDFKIEPKKAEISEKLQEAIDQSEKSDLKPALSLIEIAKKHDVSIDLITHQMELGRKIEFEHSNNPDTAEDIAKQHLAENPNYYTEAKPEGWAEEELKKEGKSTEGQETKSTINKVPDAYFTEDNALLQIKDRFGISKTLDYSIISTVPKELDTTLPDGERVYIVDGEYVRDNIYSDFAQGGNDLAYPEFVPISELWIEKAMLTEKAHILKHEKDERDLILAGKTYNQAHDIVKEAEDQERGIESKTAEKSQTEEIEKRNELMGIGSKSDKDKIAEARKRLQILKSFLSDYQYQHLSRILSGEESEGFMNLINRLASTVEAMPKSYETEDINTPDKIVYLHYFSGGSVWYIVENDKGSKDDPVPGIQNQAFGYAILNGDMVNAEWDYINIQELIENRVELDFYWTPKKFSEIKKESETLDVHPVHQDEEKDEGYGTSTQFNERAPIKADLIPVYLDADILRLIDYLNTSKDQKKKAEIWNEGKTEETGEYKIASRSRYIKETGRTLWQIAIQYPMEIEVVSEGHESKVYWTGDSLKRAIEKHLTEKGYKLMIKDKEEPVKEAPTSLIKTDYKNDFELNKAIEGLLEKKWSDPVEKWAAGELEFITSYSGYGGLDEFGQIDKGSLYEFFTPEKVIEKMWGLAYKYGYKEGRMIEPSAGIGLFMKREFVKSSVIKDAYEINKYSAKICKLLYPEANINDGLETKYFEQLFIKNNYTVRDKIKPVHELVIGNPPYGDAQGLYMGMGEKTYSKAKNYIDYFILRGLDLLLPGGLLIYIIGAEVAGGGVPWLDQGTSKCKELIMQRGKLIDAYRLPEGLFARTNVVTDIVVFRKR
jgi:hypothetical protein